MLVRPNSKSHLHFIVETKNIIRVTIQRKLLTTARNRQSTELCHEWDADGAARKRLRPRSGRRCYGSGIPPGLIISRYVGRFSPKLYVDGGARWIENRHGPSWCTLFELSLFGQCRRLLEVVWILWRLVKRVCLFVGTAFSTCFCCFVLFFQISKTFENII